MRRVILSLLFVSLFQPPSLESQPRRRIAGRSAPIVILADDFALGTQGWSASFSDYSPVSLPTMDLDSGIRPLPPELGPGTSFYIAGHNRSDDLFMFLSKRLSAGDGVAASQSYTATFRVTLGSNAGNGCAGVGGSPGDSVYLKVGAAPRAPVVTLDATDHYVVAIDKDNQSQSGTEASVAGTTGNGTTDCRDEAPLVSITRTHTHPHPVRSNGNGEIWLVVGTDSAFEGLTRLYYQRIEVTLMPAG